MKGLDRNFEVGRLSGGRRGGRRGRGEDWGVLVRVSLVVVGNLNAVFTSLHRLSLSTRTGS